MCTYPPSETCFGPIYRLWRGLHGFRDIIHGIVQNRPDTSHSWRWLGWSKPFCLSGLLWCHHQLFPLRGRKGISLLISSMNSTKWSHNSDLLWDHTWLWYFLENSSPVSCSPFRNFSEVQLCKLKTSFKTEVTALNSSASEPVNQGTSLEEKACKYNLRRCVL